MLKKIIVLILSSLVLFACRTSTEKNDKQSGELLIVYTDWAESVAITYMAQVLIERELGYKVILKLTDVEQVFNEISEGKADAFLDVWVPATHKQYLDRYEGKFEDLGPNYKLARTGLVVPDYMEVNSIEDLKKHFKGAITGIDSSAGIMTNANKAILSYELENDLLVLSDAEMTKELEQAILRRESIVVTGWEPHWLFHRYELKYLDDPLGVFMKEEQINTIARNGFSEDNPDVAEFFKRMVLSEKQINSLLFEMKLKTDPLEGVKEWIEKNEFTVNQWTKGLGEEREKIM